MLTWTVDGRQIKVGPGQALCIPRGAVHRFDNSGIQDVKALCVIHTCRPRSAVLPRVRRGDRRDRRWRARPSKTGGNHASPRPNARSASGVAARGTLALNAGFRSASCGNWRTQQRNAIQRTNLRKGRHICWIIHGPLPPARQSNFQTAWLGYHQHARLFVRGVLARIRAVQFLGAWTKSPTRICTCRWCNSSKGE